MSAENELVIRQAEEDRKSALYVWSANEAARAATSFVHFGHESDLDLALDAIKFAGKSFCADWMWSQGTCRSSHPG